MAGKSNTSATFFAQKKLLGKAHTSNLKTDGEEIIGSNIQAATSLIFGQSIPTSPGTTLYLTSSVDDSSDATVEYVPFTLQVLTGTTYDADSSGGGGGSDSGESSQSSGPHAYKFVFPSDYESNSTNPRKGNGSFDNGSLVHEKLGAVQIVPPFFSQDSPNPYIIKIFKDDGSGGIGDEIPLLDNIDWNVDFYNGILFLQDYDASKIPAHAKAFTYIGKMAEEVISSGSSGGSGASDGNAQYLVLSATGSLANERVFTAGTGITTTDGGAGGNYTVGINNSVVATISGSQFSGNVGVTGTFTVGGKPVPGADTNFFVSGTVGSVGTSTRGTAVFGGDVVISGSLKTNKEMVFNEKLSGNADGSNTLFTLASTPFSTSEVSVFVNGQLQTPSGIHTFQDYSVTGSNVFFTTASIPEVNSLVLAIYNKVT